MENNIAFGAQRVLQFFTTGEYGIIPSVAVVVREELNMSNFEIGLLGTLVYAGLMVASSYASYLFQLFKTVHVLQACLLLSCVACACKFVSVTKHFLYVGCFMSGLGHAPMFIWYNVWIDRNAPKGFETVWMGLWGISNVAGNLGFYAFTAYIYWGLGMSWRFSFAVCLVVQVAFGCLSFFTPARHFPNHKDQELQWDILWRYPVLGMTCMVQALQFFALTGVEYFGPAYFIEQLGVTPATAAKLYLVSGIGPAAGALIGAAAGDSLGGYRRRKQSILFCLLLTTMALCCLPWLLHPKDVFSGVFWSTLCLTLHAATCPLLVGLAISTEPSMRNQASSVLSLVTNGLGYMLGPSVCGWAAEKDIQFGWEMIWGPPISVTPILLFVCYILELNRPPRTQEEEEALEKLEAKHNA